MGACPTQVFSRAGDVKRIIMGLDKHQMTPCGFAFVVYYTRQDAEDAVKYISGTIMDDRPVRVDFDWGFKDGRQFGRGRSGGQVRCSAPAWSGLHQVHSWGMCLSQSQSASIPVRRTWRAARTAIMCAIKGALECSLLQSPLCGETDRFAKVFASFCVCAAIYCPYTFR